MDSEDNQRGRAHASGDRPAWLALLGGLVVQGAGFLDTRLQRPPLLRYLALAVLDLHHRPSTSRVKAIS